MALKIMLAAMIMVLPTSSFGQQSSKPVWPPSAQIAMRALAQCLKKAVDSGRFRSDAEGVSASSLLMDACKQPVLDWTGECFDIGQGDTCRIENDVLLAQMFLYAEGK